MPARPLVTIAIGSVARRIGSKRSSYSDLTRAGSGCATSSNSERKQRTLELLRFGPRGPARNRAECQEQRRTRDKASSSHLKHRLVRSAVLIEHAEQRGCECGRKGHNTQQQAVQPCEIT